MLTRVGRQATERAESAERERFMTESVQQLATELSSAVTPSDVAHTLVERLPEMLGSPGGALGLIEGERLAHRRSGRCAAADARAGDGARA